jgi:hypothetical protein
LLDPGPLITAVFGPKRRLLAWIGDDESRQDGVGAVENCHIAYSKDQRAGGALGEVAEQRITGLAIAAARCLYLDELVIVQRTGCLCGHGLCQAGVSEADEGLQVVSQATEVAALLFTEDRGYRLGRGSHGGGAWNALLAGLRGGATGADAFGLVQTTARGACGRESGRPGAAGGDVFLGHEAIVSAAPEL